MHKLVTAGEPPNGLIFHSSGPIDGWVVVDFWESRQDNDAGLPRVQEAIATAGVTMQGPPDIEEFPVFETLQRNQSGLAASASAVTAWTTAVPAPRTSDHDARVASTCAQRIGDTGRPWI